MTARSVSSSRSSKVSIGLSSGDSGGRVLARDRHGLSSCAAIWVRAFCATDTANLGRPCVGHPATERRPRLP
eukprot:scaffold118106_cov27-Phaeocystis_antarctica.AAC.1